MRLLLGVVHSLSRVTLPECGELSQAAANMMLALAIITIQLGDHWVPCATTWHACTGPTCVHTDTSSYQYQYQGI